MSGSKMTEQINLHFFLPQFSSHWVEIYRVGSCERDEYNEGFGMVVWLRLLFKWENVEVSILCHFGHPEV